MKRLKAWPFLIPAALFAGLLRYAVFNALAIYLPQRRELQSDADDSRTFGGVDLKDVKGPLLLTVRRRGF